MTELADVIVKGLLADIPTAGMEGRLYFTTDTEDIFRDNGVTWDQINVSSSSGLYEYYNFS